MRLRTDDDIYRARLVYLGPPGYTLPIHLPYAQYGVFALMVPLFMFIRYLITLQVDYFPAYEIALAIVATSLIFRYVDPDRPARMVVRRQVSTFDRAFGMKLMSILVVSPSRLPIFSALIRHTWSKA